MCRHVASKRALRIVRTDGRILPSETVKCSKLENINSLNGKREEEKKKKKKKKKKKDPDSL